MRFAAGVVSAMLASYAIVMIPRGMAVFMPEFWLTPLLYGAPLLLLAWPVYLRVFRRLSGLAWWQLALIGGLLAPVPFALLIVGDSLLRGTLPDPARPLSFYYPWRSVFGYWYGIFGVLLGAYVGLSNRHILRT